MIEPIDLGGALRLAGARDLDIAIARERVCQALAELEQARVLWLPSIYLGPNWIRHDGQAQVVEGPVRTISKSSLFLGATAAAGSSVSGPVPAGGPAQVSGLTSILRFSDAIFEPLAARQSSPPGGPASRSPRTTPCSAWPRPTSTSSGPPAGWRSPARPPPTPRPSRT